MAKRSSILAPSALKIKKKFTLDQKLDQRPPRSRVLVTPDKLPQEALSAGDDE